MKFSILALFSLVFAFEAFAQMRGPRYNNPGRGNGGGGRVIVNNGGGRNNGPVIVNGGRNNGGFNNGPIYGDNRYNQRRDRVIISSRRYDRPIQFVGPRYNPYNRSYRQVIRNYSWLPSNRLSCDSWTNSLNMNGYRVHDFMFNSECQQAIYDIQNYGDFCDDADLYDQNGSLTAQFTWESECRNALGWYY